MATSQPGPRMVIDSITLPGEEATRMLGAICEMMGMHSDLFFKFVVEDEKLDDVAKRFTTKIIQGIDMARARRHEYLSRHPPIITVQSAPPTKALQPASNLHSNQAPNPMSNAVPSYARFPQPLSQRSETTESLSPRLSDFVSQDPESPLYHETRSVWDASSVTTPFVNVQHHDADVFTTRSGVHPMWRAPENDAPPVTPVVDAPVGIFNYLESENPPSIVEAAEAGSPLLRRPSTRSIRSVRSGPRGQRPGLDLGSPQSVIPKARRVSNQKTSVKSFFGASPIVARDSADAGVDASQPIIIDS